MRDSKGNALYWEDEDLMNYYYDVVVWRQLSEATLIADCPYDNIYELAKAYGFILSTRGHERYAKIKCPFHNDNDPSCVLWKEINAYKCYACGAKGNMVSLLTHLEKQYGQTTTDRNNSEHAT